jgi:eukaryotic-like serine/threonine-protein kinase
LAVVAYELLAGHLPFECDDLEVLRLCVLNEPPEGIEGQPDSVNRALLIGLGKRRQERFESCVELVGALEGGGVSATVSATPPVRPDQAGKPDVRVAPAGPAVVKPAERITNSIGMDLVLIPAGEFLMGSPNSNSDVSNDEKPQHKVRITKPFYLAVTPVTQEQYKQVMGHNPSHFKGNPQRPVEQVSWDEAFTFCHKLSEQDGNACCLPTEAEWERACRGGSTGEWCFGDNESLLNQYAWIDGKPDGTTHPVGQKKPNAWGLYDMHGNVWEWCSDWYGQYTSTALDDPTGPTAGSIRMFRGGSWGNLARYCRSAYRGRGTPGSRFNYLGFRVACSSVDGSGQ